MNQVVNSQCHRDWPVVCFGSPSDPPLVCLHGWMGSHREWIEVLPTISTSMYCICPDAPGHGSHSLDGWDESSLHFSSVCDSLVHMLTEQMGLSSWHLGGYSMGGRMALYIACRYPQYVDSLWLESCRPGLSDPIEREQRAVLDTQRADFIRNGDWHTFVDQWYEAPLFSSLANQPALLLGIKEARKQNDPHDVAALLEAMSPGRQPPLWKELAHCHIPTLLLAGELDIKYTVVMSKMEALMPRSTFEMVPKAGHSIHAERPTRWIQHLSSFLKQQTS